MNDEAEELRAEFGRRLKEARKAIGMTQGRLAELTDMNLGHISEIERGLQNVTIGTMTTLAKAVGMSVEVGLTASSPRRKKRSP